MEQLFGNDQQEEPELVVSEPRQSWWLGLSVDRMVASSLGQLDGWAWGMRETVAVPGQTSFTDIVERVSPVLYLIMDFIADRPLDAVRFSCLTANFIFAETRVAQHSLWRTLYEQRWPAFHDALSHKSRAEVLDWRAQYQETLAGNTTITLEVYHRERKRGFAMSVMPANVSFKAKRNVYMADYISASQVHPEAIPVSESYRLRFCPSSTREHLEPDLVAKPREQDQEQSLHYPYRVLQDTTGLIPGQSVELQWKMQWGSPFGWWYGTLEAITRETNGPHATATILFDHFPKHSRWYRMEVRFGDAEIRPNDFGGFTGGIRACSHAETRHWNQYFPQTFAMY